MRHQRRIQAIILAAACAASACASGQRARVETARAQTLISDEQSNQIGYQVHADVKQGGVSYVDDPAVRAYVESIGARIFAIARSDRSGIDYHLHVIDDPRSVNAFAAPGGHLFVYSGLLLEAANEAEVAAVIGHETGHVVGRHVERAIVNAYGLQALTAAALGRNPSPAQELAAGIAGTGIMRAHSRSEETEADEYGVRSNSSLGYDPHAMITFLERLQARAGGSARVPKWLSTHPLTPDRIQHLKEYIERNRLPGRNLGDQRLAEVKRQLSAPTRSVS